MVARFTRAVGLTLLLSIAAQAQVTGPAKVPPGTLVVLRSDAEAQWIAIEPVDLTFEQFEGGKALAFSSGCKSGRVIVLCVSWDSRRIDRHIVTIEGDAPQPGPGPGPGPTPTDVWPDVVAALTTAIIAVPEAQRAKLLQVAGNYESERAAVMALPAASFNRKLSSERLRTANIAIMSEPDRIAAKPVYDALVALGKQYDGPAESREGFVKWLTSVARGLRGGK